jgi:hypothetical protein
VLLEMLFRLACRYAGQAPSPTHYLRELQETTQANIGWQRALTYLRFLNDSLLIRLIEGTELEFVIMVIAVSCVKLLSAHNSTQHTSRKHKV